ncbi:hypothetical protein C0992_005379, partial [Termitomyces sp. T32_za158]
VSGAAAGVPVVSVGATVSMETGGSATAGQTCQQYHPEDELDRQQAQEKIPQGKQQRAQEKQQDALKLEQKTGTGDRDHKKDRDWWIYPHAKLAENLETGTLGTDATASVSGARSGRGSPSA